MQRREGTALCCLEVELAAVAEALDVENKGGRYPGFWLEKLGAHRDTTY